MVNSIFFPQCFLPFPKQIPIFQPNLMSSANAFNLDQAKNLSFVKELNLDSEDEDYNTT